MMFSFGIFTVNFFAGNGWKFKSCDQKPNEKLIQKQAKDADFVIKCIPNLFPSWLHILRLHGTILQKMNYLPRCSGQDRLLTDNVDRLLYLILKDFIITCQFCICELLNWIRMGAIVFGFERVFLWLVRFV